MKIIDRYLLRETFPPFLVGVGVFSFVILMSQFLRLVELIVNKGVGVGVALKLILYLFPSILVMTVPMSVLLGALAAFGRLSADNEVTALKSGGISLWRLSWPVAGFSLFAFALTFYMIATALPAANQAFRGMMFEIVRGKASLGLTERVFNDDFDGLIIYVNQIPVVENPVMKGILIHDYRGENETPRREPLTIFAEEGWLMSDPKAKDVIFRLRNGSIHSLGRDKLTYQHINFGDHDLHLSMLEELGGAINLPKGIREMTIGELQDKVRELKGKGLPHWPPLVELHKKVALPFACLIFGFLGVALGVIFRKGEKMVSFAVCIGVVIVYYIFLVAGEPIGKQGLLPAWLSMWAANIFFGIVTLFLFLAATFEVTPAGGLADLIPSLRRRSRAGA
jgi:lipopolysaccharide export system permease protein